MKKIFSTIALAALFFSCSNDDSTMTVPAQSQKLTNTVAAAPAGIADFKLTDANQSVNEGSYMELKNSSVNAKSYYWEFGDGETSTEKEPRHLYHMCGSYFLKLTVTDANGHKTVFGKDVPVLCTIISHHNPTYTSGS